MSTRSGARWAVKNLSRLTQQQLARTDPYRKKGKPLTEQEQLRRFVAGEERWRLDQGLVSPMEWAEYEAAMLQKLGV